MAKAHLQAVTDRSAWKGEDLAKRPEEWTYRLTAADVGEIDAALAVARDVMHHLAAAGGMADMDGLLQVQMRRHRGEIVGIVIHVVAVADLRGTAVAAAVMGDDPITVIEEEQHLCVPVVGRQRPAVTEDDGLTRTPVLVEDLNAVLGRDVHDFLLSHRATGRLAIVGPIVSHLATKR